MKRSQRIWLISGIMAMMLAGVAIIYHNPDDQYTNVYHPDTLILLTQDETVHSDRVNGWLFASQEEGLHMQAMSDHEFKEKVRAHHHYPGVILADQIHDKISLAMISLLREYFKTGGQLMLVYSAATIDEAGNYFEQQAPFSDLIGTPYALYSSLGRSTISWSEVGQDKMTLSQLGIPQGKYIALENPGIAAARENTFYAISGYQYGALIYPHFTTKPEPKHANTLLSTLDGQVVAKRAPYDKGAILFVNLPLTYLWINTDRLLMHAFLHYFAIDVVRLPYLSMSPSGIGGIIFDIQLPDKAAFNSLQTLLHNGFLPQGPFSIDVSAGPDTNQIGDGNGIDLNNNPQARNTLLDLARKAWDIGSLGGWIYNYFGTNINDQNRQAFEPYIQHNQETLQTVLGKPVTSYSTPLMNQPVWLRDALTQHHFTAYTTAQNTGSAPARSYINGQFDREGLWAFPIMPFGKYQEFQEFYMNHVPEAEVSTWLNETAEFTASQHTIRLIYSEAQGIENYSHALKSWFTFTGQLQQKDRFRWYTMAQIAQFLTNRQKTTWTVLERSSNKVFTASNPASLEHQAWLIKKNTCLKPIITQGTGAITEDADNWIVSAGATQSISWQCRGFSKENRPQPAFFKAGNLLSQDTPHQLI